MKALQKDTIREIRKSLSRFFSIVAIIALGIGFFSGVKSTSPSMKETADDYYREQKLMDLHLISTYGFTDSDIQEIAKTEGVGQVEGGYTADLLVKEKDKQRVAKVYSLPDSGGISQPVLIEGRLPEKDDECVIEVQETMGEDLGKVSYPIGSTVTFSEKTGETPVTDTLTRPAYRVVGYVRSPMYVSIERGSTSVGTGSVDFYMMLRPEAFKSERYTDCYVRGDFHDETLSGYSAAYDDQVAALAKRLETTGQRLLEESYQKMLSEGQQKIDEGRLALLEAQATFDAEIIAAQTKLSSGEQEILDGEAALSAGEAAYQEKMAQAEAEIAQNEATLIRGENQYQEGLKAFEEGFKAWEEGQKAFEEARPQAEETFEKADRLVQEAGTFLDLLKEIVADLEINEPEHELLPYLKEGLVKAEEAFEKGCALLQEKKDAFHQAEADLNEAKDQLDQSRQQLDEAYAKIESGKQALAAGKESLEAGRRQGASELEAGRQKLEEGRAALIAGREEYERQKAAGEARLAEARQALSEGEQKLSEIPEGRWYLFNRHDNPGYTSYGEDADRIDKVASIFPVFFLLVAALVSFTTMTRMVEEQRMAIGTLKALGYGYGRIAAKYIFYAALAAVIGCISGILIGVNTLPYLITTAYSLLYNMPEVTLHVPWLPVLLSCVVALLCTTGAAIGISWFEFRNEPSELMRPKAPKVGKQILMERITPIWKRMGFISKVTARNIFRYKARFIMTVVGIAGCTALILAGFGLQDSIFSIVPQQFGEISIYDAVAAFKKEGTAEEKAPLAEKLLSDSDIAGVMPARQMKMNVSAEGFKGKKEVFTVILQEPDKLSAYVDLHDRKDPQQKRPLPEDGAVITEKLARDLGLSLGDPLTLSADQQRFEVKVGGIAENYIENYVYLSPDYYQQASGEVPKYNLAFINLNISGAEAEDALAERWLAGDDLVSMAFTESIKNSSMDSLKSLNMVVLVMLVAAGALAFVVLYNLTSINVSERVREIATIRVLGFYDREVDHYIFRENIVLSLIGMVFGLFLGVLLNNFIITTVETDIVMFGRGIEASSYGFACLFTMAFTLIVNFFMKPVIRRIDMVESLKSIE